jgi:uncharacterized repeat protein (TIGR01451 family)
VLTDSASASGTTFDNYTANNTASKATTVDTQADLSILKSDSPDPVLIGDDLTYTLTVTNNGPSNNTGGYHVSDTLPLGLTFKTAGSSAACAKTGTSGTGQDILSCTNTTGLAAGAHVDYTVVAHVEPSFTDGQSISNTASVTSDGTSDVAGNNSSTASTTVNKRSVTLVYTGATAGAYSDPANLAATLTDTKTGQPIGNKSITFSLGTQTMTATTLTTGPNAGVATTDDSLARRLNQQAGSYTVTASFAGDTTYKASNSNPSPYTINREDANIPDIQPTAVQTSATTTNIPITLTIDEAQDGYLSQAFPPGLANAKPITVVISSVSNGATFSCSPAAADTTYVSGDPDTATAHCTIPNVPVDVYDVVATIGGNYFQGGGESALDVYNPSLGFTTGGGTYTDDNGNRVNFGFTAKVLKSGQVQGSMLTVVHTPKGVYTLKSNSMGALAISSVNDSSGKPLYWTATFTGKATYGVPPSQPPLYCGDRKCGGYTWTVYVEDRKEPGTGSDKYWIQAKDPNTPGTPLLTLISIAGTPANVYAKTIDGGNIQVPQPQSSGK